jgi:hypothetical protein
MTASQFIASCFNQPKEHTVEWRTTNLQYEMAYVSGIAKLAAEYDQAFNQFTQAQDASK